MTANTSRTLLVADMETQQCSEITWTHTGNEKFYFDSENVRVQYCEIVLQFGSGVHDIQRWRTITR